MTTDQKYFPWREISRRFVLGMAFTFSVLQSISVSVAWWRGELLETGAREWFWIGLLPILMFIFLRYFSVFRPDCAACNTPPRVGPGA